ARDPHDRRPADRRRTDGDGGARQVHEWERPARRDRRPLLAPHRHHLDLPLPAALFDCWLASIRRPWSTLIWRNTAITHPTSASRRTSLNRRPIDGSSSGSWCC